MKEAKKRAEEAPKDSKTSLNELSGEILDLLGPVSQSISEEDIEELETSEEYNRFNQNFRQYLTEKAQIDNYPQAAEDAKVLLEKYKSIIDSMQKEDRSTKIASGVGLVFIASALLAGAVLPVGAVVGLASLGTASSFFGYVNKILNNRKQMEEATAVSKAILAIQRSTAEG